MVRAQQQAYAASLPAWVQLWMNWMSLVLVLSVAGATMAVSLLFDYLDVARHLLGADRDRGLEPPRGGG